MMLKTFFAVTLIVASATVFVQARSSVKRARCAESEYPCNNGKCIPASQRCDDNDDCGDGSDEGDYGLCNRGEKCLASDFQCRDQKQCVSNDDFCDGENDCNDASDEDEVYCAWKRKRDMNLLTDALVEKLLKRIVADD